MKKLLSVLALLLLIGAAIGIYLWNKPHETAGNVKTELFAPAGEIYAAFEADSSAANKKYLGKMIEISGKVTGSEKVESGPLIIYLEAPSDMGVVSCSMLPEVTSAPAEQTEVTIKGWCNGYLGDLLPKLEFKDCLIVNKQQPPN